MYPCMGSKSGASFTATTIATATCRLYIFCGDHLLCARLRPANIDGAKGSAWEVRRLVGRIRKRWPGVRILVRGDSGFCRERLIALVRAA